MSVSVCLSVCQCACMTKSVLYVQESARQAFTMYPSRNVDKVWEVATMLAHRDMRVTNSLHPTTTTTTLSTTAATTTAAAAGSRFNVNGTSSFTFILSFLACTTMSA